MGLNLDLKRGENTRAVSVNGSWVHQTRNGASERSGFVGTGDPNEMAIAWTTELLAKGWLFDELGLSDVKPGELTAVSRQLPCPSKLALRARPLDVIDEIAEFPALVALTLNGVTSKTDLAPISRLPQLVRLEISVGDARGVIGAVPELPALRAFSTDRLNGIDTGLLRRFQGLERLSVASAQLSNLSFLAEAGLPLRELELHWLDVSSLSLRPVEAIAPTLERLSIWLRDVAVTDAHAIGRCQNLRSLKLKGVAVPPDALGALAKLTSADLDDAVPLAPLGGLAALEQLTLSLPEDKEPARDGVKALVGNTRLKIVFQQRDWSAVDLEKNLTETFELFELLASKGAVRSARRIKTKEGGASAPAHFGGGARLATGEAWPHCKNCERPMPLFVEMDLAKLELPTKVAGLLQMFYCNSTEPLCEVDCESWKQNDRAMLLRVVPATVETAAVEAPELPQPVAERSIELGAEKADSPDSQDAGDRYGIYDAPDRTLGGDKLLGWPYWVQGNEWPSCPECAKPMDLLLQMQSDKGIAHQWGDSGHAYLFLCFDHPTRVGFVWQGC